VLLESEDHECPDCKEKDVSPDTLIPNRFLRNNVNNFKNETGYNKGSMRQPRCQPHPSHGQLLQVIGAPPPSLQQMVSEPSGSLREFTEASAGLFQLPHFQ
jgi:E3 ubiquitin-protein ligase RBBP6